MEYVEDVMNLAQDIFGVDLVMLKDLMKILIHTRFTTQCCNLDKLSRMDTF